MPRRKADGRGAKGNGSIRKRIVTKNGRTYEYWEARITVGRDPGTGRQIQKSFTGATQKEVREKMQAVAVEVNENTYQEPTKLSLAEWLDMWITDYLVDIKPRTLNSYKTTIRVHIKPALGAIKLAALKSTEIQKFYNELRKNGRSIPKRDSEGNAVKENGKAVYEKVGLSGKTIMNIHGVLHKALQQAVEIGFINSNPSSPCKLPRAKRREITPLDHDAVAQFLGAIRGHSFELLYTLVLFTGLREGEALGLTWDCIDFARGVITIKQQLQKEREGKGEYHLVSPKNDKTRRITPAQSVMDLLEIQRQRQSEARELAGDAWENKMNLVFTNALGRHLSAQTVYLHFKRIVTTIGLPAARFHDLRHSYAVAALQCGDDIKTVQENMGHFSAAFTLDVYGHVTEKMKRNSAERMERYIQSVKM